MKWWLVAMGLCVAACGSDDNAAGRQFKDTSGRTCSVSNGDVSCSGPGASCSAGETSTYVVVGLEGSAMEMYPGCKEKGGSTSYDTSAGSEIVCGASADCGFAAASCQAGLCWCAPGKCP